MGETVGSFVGQGGLRIAYRCWAPSTPHAPRATVVVVHTALDHSARYEELARALVRPGMAVWAHDQRGHGLSEGQPGVIDRLAHAVADLDAMVDLATTGHGAPLFVVGHGMGAVVALQWALDGGQDRLAGLVTTSILLDSSPAPLALRVLGDGFRLDRVGSWLSPRFPLLAFPPETFTSDPAEARDHDEDPLVHHGRIPLRTASELATAIRGDLRTRLGELEAPLLAVHGGGDVIVGVRASKRLVESAGSTDATLVVHDGLLHDVLHERRPQRQAVIDEIVGWIEARAA